MSAPSGCRRGRWTLRGGLAFGLGLAAFMGLGPRPIAAEPVVPRLEGPVTDLADLLEPADEQAILQILQPLEAQTGAQVAVLTVPSLEGEPIETFAIAVARQWALGQEGRDNGLLILVAREERELRIEVGEGLEGAVTDLTSKRIIEERMVPRFRDGDFGGGIVAAVSALDPIIRGEPMPEAAAAAGEAVGSVIFLTLFYLVIGVLGLAGMAVGGLFATLVYLVVLPFSYLVPVAVANPTLAALSGWGWAGGYPLLYFSWGHWLRTSSPGSRQAGGKQKRRDPFEGWTIHSGGRGSSGGFGGSSGGGWSGGGGSFGGGGASGKW